MEDSSFINVIEELEELDRNFRLKGSPPGYEGVWLPNNEVKLWSIPRNSAEIL
jgi:hypothetical protein